MADILASVSVVLGAEISGFKAAMASARKELSGLVKFSEGLKDVGESLTKYVTAPLLGMGAAAVKIGGGFQAEFNKVEAATQATGTQLEALRKKAQNIALDPNLKFSSIDAADALEALAKNGVSVTDILGGAADASTSLATATGARLAVAADITTDVMNNFGKSAAQASGLVSSITGTTIASKFAIDDYKLALGQAGAVAGQLGVSFADFNTALGVTSSGFSSGSDAGTSFKTFLQRLVPQTKEAQDAMKQLGLNFFDAQGKMRPLREIAGQLQKAFKGLSDEQRSTLGTKIFGADSIRTALLLAKEGAEGFDKMAASIAKVDAAAQGKVLNKGFVGALEAFKSAAEGAAQAVAESGILDAATRLAQTGASIAGALATADPALLKFGVGLAAAAAAIGPLLVAVGSLGLALPALEAGLLVLSGPVGLVVAGIAAAAVLIVANWDNLVAYFKPSGEGGRVFSNLAASVKDSMSVIGTAIKSIAGLGGGTLGDLLSLGTAFKFVFREIAVGLTAISDIIGGTIGAVVKLFKGDFTGSLEEAKRAIFGLIDPIANLFGFTKKTSAELQGLKGSFDAAFKPLTGGFDGTLGAVGDFGTAIDQFGLITGKVSAITEAQAAALAKLKKELLDNENASRALGDKYDFLGTKSSILTAGIKNLTDVGFAPGGLIVSGYKAALDAVPAAMDRISARIPDLVKNLNKTPDFKLQVPELGGIPETLKPIDSTAFVSSLAPVTEAMVRAQRAGEQLSEGLSTVLSQGLTNAAVSFGQAVGSILAGTEGLASIPAALLGALGAVAVQVGELAIATGVAVLGIKAALASLNPALAIAGGIALVALGTAVSGAASNIGKGGGNTASFSSSSISARTAPAASPQRVDVFVTGVLRASGADLSAALRTTDYRRIRTN